MQQVSGRRLGSGRIFEGGRKAGKGEGRSFVWLGMQKADLMSICSGRRKQQVLLSLAQDLLLSSESKCKVEESSRVSAHSVSESTASGIQGMNSIILNTSPYLCIFETGDGHRLIKALCLC